MVRPTKNLPYFNNIFFDKVFKEKIFFLLHFCISPGPRYIQLGQAPPPLTDDTDRPSLSCVAPQLSASIELPGAILKECLHCKKKEKKKERGLERESKREVESKAERARAPQTEREKRERERERSGVNGEGYNCAQTQI